MLYLFFLSHKSPANKITTHRYQSNKKEINLPYQAGLDDKHNSGEEKRFAANDFMMRKSFVLKRKSRAISIKFEVSFFIVCNVDCTDNYGRPVIGHFP